MYQFSSFQLLSRVRLFATLLIATRQASLSITNSQSSPTLMSVELVMPFSHLILCRPLLLLPPIPPSIRVFSNESTLRMRRPEYWSFSFSIIPSKEIPGWHIEYSTFTASSFRIWNSSTGIPSPPLALFVVMCSKAYLTSHSRMSGSRWVITPLWLSWSWDFFFVQFFCVFLPPLLNIICFC